MIFVRSLQKGASLAVISSFPVKIKIVTFTFELLTIPAFHEKTLTYW